MTKKRYTGQGGPNDRRLRYDTNLTIKLTQKAKKQLKLMATAQKTKPATIGRRAVMKDIYIFEAERKRHQEIEEELGPDEPV